MASQTSRFFAICPTGDRAARLARCEPGSHRRLDRRARTKGLSPEGFALLLPPASDAFVEEFGVAGVVLPGFGKFGAVAARTAIRRQVVKADAHRQRDAFAERDRLLCPHGR